MPIASGASGALFLELDGKPAGRLDTGQPAGIRVDLAAQSTGRETVLRRSAQVVLGEMGATFDLVEPGPLTEWLQAGLAGDLAPRQGALVVADIHMTARRRIGFRGARLTSLAWPLLSASDGKRPVRLALRWLADAVDDAPASGKLLATASRRKAMLAGNFRVGGLPFGADAVAAVQLPGLQVEWSQARTGSARQPLQSLRRVLGTLDLDLVGGRADVARAWVHKLVADGNVDERDGFALQVDLLDAALKKALATVHLTGCLLAAMDEDPLGAAAGRSATLRLRFHVGGMTLTLN